MKHAFLSGLFLVGAASLAQGQVFDIPIVRDARRVDVTHVDASMAFAPGLVSLYGRNLGLVTEVRLGDLVVPVVRNDGARLMIQLAPQDPGFADLRVFQGQRSLERKIEFLPSLKAQWRNGRVGLTLHPGAPGWYVVLFSFRRLDTPNQYPGIYYSEWLDMSGSHTGALYTGPVEGDESLVFPAMRMPLAGGIGAWRTMHVQAICMGQESTCYSNAVTLRPTL